MTKTAIYLTTIYSHIFDYTNVTKTFKSCSKMWSFLIAKSRPGSSFFGRLQTEEKIDRFVSFELETYNHCKLSLLQNVVRRGKRTKINCVSVRSHSLDSSAKNRREPSISMDSTGPGSPIRCLDISYVHRISEKEMMLQLYMIFLDLMQKASTNISDIVLQRLSKNTLVLRKVFHQFYCSKLTED